MYLSFKSVNIFFNKNYFLLQAVETCYNMLKSSGYVKDLPLGEVCSKNHK